MSKRPRFSVLLPTHNRPDVIGYAIKSVLRQTEQDFELLVVGDGCTDNTAEIVQGFDDPRIRWFDLPKAPHFGYANRNVALKQARGELIAFMAHDDMVFDDHLALLAETLESNGAEWAYSRPLWVNLEGVVIAYPMNLYNPSELEVFLTRYNTIPASCVMHRRDCFDKYGYWPEDMPAAADWTFWVRMLEGGGRSNFAHCREPTCLHFVADWQRAKPSRFRPEDSPVVTSCRISPGRSEQEIFFEAMISPDWVPMVREETRRAVDRIAWRAMVALGPRIKKLAAKEQEARRGEAEARREAQGAVKERERVAKELGKASISLAKALEELAMREAELDAVHESSSWRLTAPLRALKRAFRRRPS